MIKKCNVLSFSSALSENLVKKCKRKKEEKKEKNQISISTYFPNDYLERAAEKFEKKYPDVLVTINSYKKIVNDREGLGKDLTPINNLENYGTYLDTALKNGIAEDMILLSWLPINKYVERDYLLDLTQLIEDDQDLNNDNYYMNVLTANRFNNIVYSIPINFEVIMFGINERVLKRAGLKEELLKGDYWDFNKMMEIMNSIPDREEKQIYLQVGSGLNIFSWIWQLENKKFINLEKKSVNLDTEAFVELLKECKELETKNFLYPGVDISEHVLFSSFMARKHVFYENKYIKPLVNEADEIDIGSSNEICITKNTNNKELCWKFIKFLLSQEMQEDENLHGYAMNKEATAIRNNKKLKEFLQDSQMEKEISEGEKIRILEELKSKIERWSSKSVIDSGTYEINDKVQEKVILFFQGEKSAEEVAEILQDKICNMINK